MGPASTSKCIAAPCANCRALALMCEPGVPTLTVIGHVVDLFADAPPHYPASPAPAHLARPRVAV